MRKKSITPKPNPAGLWIAPTIIALALMFGIFIVLKNMGIL
jgi:hypothetical protein